MHDRMMSGGRHFNHQYPGKQVHKRSERKGGEEYPNIKQSGRPVQGAVAGNIQAYSKKVDNCGSTGVRSREKQENEKLLIKQ